MKRYFFVVVILTIPAVLCQMGEAFGQSLMYSTSTGNTRFSSETPLENIKAENKKSQAILNTSTGELAIRMNMRDFVFPNKLMQEHFNENYMESEKYPTGTFSGKMDKVIDYSKDGEYETSATGKFTVHGVTKTRTISGKIKIEDGKISVNSDFQVPLADHKIDVPEIVFVKIAQKIDVKAQYVLVPVKK
ncbi:YceI family protein [Dyadobacter psychrotolerans]|uniref:YceI family protein n=1 Tax=Dyadobacter psychrotolerans TaxID=2541721 RepID=A0A4R5DIC6_9BACT|nr:YceI family protein [Dyadobacter psychrotolerans]TDE13659.1 YceI family protein [Dyadobacter psychrotolerans]